MKTDRWIIFNYVDISIKRRHEIVPVNSLYRTFLFSIFSSVGGLGEQIRELREVIELPLLNPELFQRVGITPPKGCLLYGPPGTGKTLLARAVASQLDANFLKVRGHLLTTVLYYFLLKLTWKTFKFQSKWLSFNVNCTNDLIRIRFCISDFIPRACWLLISENLWIEFTKSNEHIFQPKC